MATRHTTTRGPTRTESIQFMLLYGIGFTAFLVIALFGRALPKSWRPWPGGAEGNYVSIIAEAKAMAQTFMPFAFMG
jgi:hypothetical protein